MAGPAFRSPADRAAALAFFRGHDPAHALFHRVVAAVATEGPFELTATKSRVALTARTRFVWCHEANDDGSIWLGFLLPRRVDSPRLRSGPAGGRWSHHTKVAGPADLDSELVAWLREAHRWDVEGTAGKRVQVPKAKAGTAKPSSRPRRVAAAARAATRWTCPRCGQRFARTGQSHSCDRRAVEELFADYPRAVKVTQLVQVHLDQVAAQAGEKPVRVAATKTQVSLAAHRRFAWVWVPRQAAGSGPKDPFVSFALRRRLDSKRPQDAVNARGDLWTHHVAVPSARDVDAELKGWLAEAFETVGRP